MPRTVIYGLEDPRNGVIRYVGQSSNVYRRFIEHINVEKPVKPKDYWVMELKNLNLMVVMRTLEIVDGTVSFATERETYWIHHYLYLAVKAGLTTFNMSIPVNKIKSLPITETEVIEELNPNCKLNPNDYRLNDRQATELIDLYQKFRNIKTCLRAMNGGRGLGNRYAKHASYILKSKGEL